MSQCKSMEMIKVVPEPQSNTIGFVHPGFFGWDHSCKSGPIKCVKGFKVVFTLRQPCPGHSDWKMTQVYLFDDRIPVNQNLNKLLSDVSNVPAYGVCGAENYPHNLKTNSSGSPLPHTEPITLEYDRKAKTVKFTSKNFDYYQTNVPKDVTYAIGVFLA